MVLKHSSITYYCQQTNYSVIGEIYILQVFSQAGEPVHAELQEPDSKEVCAGVIICLPFYKSHRHSTKGGVYAAKLNRGCC